MMGVQIQWDSFRKPSDSAAEKWAAVEILKKRTGSDGPEYLVKLTLAPSQLYDEVRPRPVCPSSNFPTKTFFSSRLCSR